MIDGETTWRRILGCRRLCVMRSACQYRGVIDLGFGPRVATVRYYRCPEWWPDPKPSAFPHQFGNPWFDKVEGKPGRWTPGAPPSWRNGAVPAPIEPCSCGDNPCRPPVVLGCGQLPWRWQGRGIVYFGSLHQDVDPIYAEWDEDASLYRFEFPGLGRVVRGTLVYVDLTASFTGELTVDGHYPTAFVAGFGGFYYGGPAFPDPASGLDELTLHFDCPS